MKAASMTDVTQILSQIEHGDPAAAERLLPLVYDELRQLAAAKLANEKPGQTLQATALVHEAYIRLVDVEHASVLGFGAAISLPPRPRRCGESLSKTLAARDARSTAAIFIAWSSASRIWQPLPRTSDLLAIDEALERLAEEDPQAAELVKLRFFAGFSIPEAAEIWSLPHKCVRAVGLRAGLAPLRSRRIALREPDCASKAEVSCGPCWRVGYVRPIKKSFPISGRIRSRRRITLWSHVPW